MNKNNDLSIEEQLCFKCTLPPECCGDPKYDAECIFLEATKDKPKLRFKSPKIQHKCGVREPRYGDD